MICTPAAIMPAARPSTPALRLVLTSRLEDLGLAWPWVEALADHYHIPAQTRFAIEICLEEALSNIVHHGYCGQGDRPITVDCELSGAGELVFTIEDEAPRFDPCAADESPAHASIEELKPGGQGIRLMRKFAGRVTWAPAPNGNRLTLAFALPH